MRSLRYSAWQKYPMRSWRDLSTPKRHTLLQTDMYTQNEKCVLYCVVSQKEIVALKELVVEIDPKAFVIVSDVREVLGEGFLEYAEE